MSQQHRVKRIGLTGWTLLLFLTLFVLPMAVAQKDVTQAIADDEAKPVEMQAAENIIHGKVMDEEGQPVVNAKVGFIGVSWDTELPAVTDNNGEFTLVKPNSGDTPFAIGDLQAMNAERTKIGFSQDTFNINLQTTQIVLRQARTITGTVVDADGNPAKDVLVAGCNQITSSEIVTTNEKGEFDFIYPEEMSLQIVYTVQKDTGFDFVPTDELPSYYGETPKEQINNGPFHLKLRPVEPFKIRVVDESGNPIAGARVSPWLIKNPVKPKNLLPANDNRSDFNTSGMSIFNEKTDADGYAVINSVPGDFLKHSVFNAFGWNAIAMPDGTRRNFGHIQKTWEELTKDDASPTISLPLLPTVHVSVKLEDGTPVPNATLRLRFHEGSCGSRVTDANGETILFDNVNTLYNISINSDKGAAPAVFNFNIGDGTEEKRLDIVLEKGIRIYGKIFNPDGTLYH